MSLMEIFWEKPHVEKSLLEVSVETSRSFNIGIIQRRTKLLDRLFVFCRKTNKYIAYIQACVYIAIEDCGACFACPKSLSFSIFFPIEILLAIVAFLRGVLFWDNKYLTPSRELMQEQSIGYRVVPAYMRLASISPYDTFKVFHISRNSYFLSFCVLNRLNQSNIDLGLMYSIYLTPISKKHRQVLVF
eukprot:NODE_255_length_12751_cov_0.188587.p6 type:complete len:188 gc:universal NODE_255_length_12751_cov_0.188587:12632-12069(-)